MGPAKHIHLISSPIMPALLLFDPDLAINGACAVSSQMAPLQTASQILLDHASVQGCAHTRHCCAAHASERFQPAAGIAPARLFQQAPAALPLSLAAGRHKRGDVTLPAPKVVAEVWGMAASSVRPGQV